MHSGFCSNFRGGLAWGALCFARACCGLRAAQIAGPCARLSSFAEVFLLRAQAWGTKGTVLGCLLLSCQYTIALHIGFVGKLQRAGTLRDRIML